MPEVASVSTICRRARVAARKLAPRDRIDKDRALLAMAAGLRSRAAEIVAANERDVQEARARGTSAALIDRLSLDARRVDQMADAVAMIAELDDPVGHVLFEASARPPGVRRVSVPIGVIAIRVRVTPERHRRRERALSEGGRCGRLAWGLRRGAVERSHRLGGARCDRGWGLPPARCRRCPRVSATRSLESFSSRRSSSIRRSRRGGESLIRFVQEMRACP